MNGTIVYAVMTGILTAASAATHGNEPPRAVPTPRYAGEMEIVVHRGANHLAPENTMASARKAVELGAQYVEVDVRTSADGVFYIMHDPKVDRTTDGEGLLREMTSAQIDKLDAGSWFDPRFKGERVPRLRALLEWIRGKAKVYFDVKDADLDKLIALVRELKMQDDVFFWFGNKLEAMKLRRIDKTLPVKINVKDLKELAQAKRWFNPHIVETSVDVATPEFIKRANELGIRVMILYTGDDREVFKRIVRSGAQMVNLDRLTLFIDVWREQHTGKPSASRASVGSRP
jgi:glycerophosphoryl diester phosphodiesterase